MLVYIHIPKTAGSTINAILMRNFGEGYFHFHTDRNGDFLSDVEVMDMINSFQPRAQVISGHDIRPLDSTTSKSLGLSYFTFIRHPIKRAISLYHYERARTNKNHISQFPFDEYVNQRIKQDKSISNWQTYNIVESGKFEDAIDILENFMMVGVVEKFDISLIILKKYLQKPYFNINQKPVNISQKKIVSFETLPKQILEQLTELNQEDLKLYDYANKRLEKEAAKIANLDRKVKILRQKKYIISSLSNIKSDLKISFKNIIKTS